MIYLLLKKTHNVFTFRHNVDWEWNSLKFYLRDFRWLKYAKYAFIFIYLKLEKNLFYFVKQQQQKKKNLPISKYIFEKHI